jgi:putative PIN family toxin of toxin-antitoxin system
MTTAILDTNVFVQASFGSSRSSSFRTIAALEDGRFRLVLSPAAIDELLDVLRLPQIRERHGWSDDEILRFVVSFVQDSIVCPDAPMRYPELRDVSDFKFLAVAEASKADFLVTNDRRHLLPLRRHHNTQIVTPAEFLARLG